MTLLAALGPAAGADEQKLVSAAYRCVTNSPTTQWLETPNAPHLTLDGVRGLGGPEPVVGLQSPVRLESSCWFLHPGGAVSRPTPMVVGRLLFLRVADQRLCPCHTGLAAGGSRVLKMWQLSSPELKAQGRERKARGRPW